MHINDYKQKVIWQPQPGSQTDLLECPVFEVFFGGARGGGKTESSIGDWLAHSNKYGENAIGIFFRRKLVQLSEVIARTKQIFPKIGARYNEQKKEWIMANGARLKFAYLEHDSDAEEYQGHNYTRIYIEEATNFPSPVPINKLRACLRSGAGVPVGMRLTGNPGGAGHNWVKARYIDPAPEGYKIIKETTRIPTEDGGWKTVSLSRVFIPSKVGDNQLLMKNDPTYILRLRQSGSEALVRAWLEGDWSIIDGAFFSEFSEEKHIIPAIEWKKCGMANNPQLLRFRAFDWGSAKPFSVGWYAMTDRDYEIGRFFVQKGALVKYREWYGASGINTGLKMTADKVAEGILNREAGERIRYGVADPAIFIRDGGMSIAETMAIVGCGWRRADNRRQSGWEVMRQRLLDKEGHPMLFFLDCCEDTIRTIPTLQHDEHDMEDLDTEGEDHAADETRYAIMSRPHILTPRPSQLYNNYPKLPSEMTINELIERNRKKRLAMEDTGEDYME